MRCSGVQPIGCVVRVDAAADLHATRIGREGALGRRVVSRSKFNNVPAGQFVVAIPLGEPLWRMIGDEILHQLIIFIVVTQRTANNLFDTAVV